VLVVLASLPASFIKPLPGVSQNVYGKPLLCLCLGKMPLRSDFVSARFYPLGVQGAQHVLGHLNGRLGVGELELGLPVCGLGEGQLLLC
jgi:hypothetical protein